MNNNSSSSTKFQVAAIVPGPQLGDVLAALYKMNIQFNLGVIEVEARPATTTAPPRAAPQKAKPNKRQPTGHGRDVRDAIGEFIQAALPGAEITVAQLREAVIKRGINTSTSDPRIFDAIKKLGIQRVGKAIYRKAS